MPMQQPACRSCVNKAGSGTGQGGRASERRRGLPRRRLPRRRRAATRQPMCPLSLHARQAFSFAHCSPHSAPASSLPANPQQRGARGRSVLGRRADGGRLGERRAAVGRRRLHSLASPSSREMSTNTEDVCWLCLGEDSSSERLERPCACPRFAHRACLARWQLQKTGHREERACRFCDQELPDWKTAHAELPKVGLGHAHVHAAQPNRRCPPSPTAAQPTASPHPCPSFPPLPAGAPHHDCRV